MVPFNASVCSTKILVKSLHFASIVVKFTISAARLDLDSPCSQQPKYELVRESRPAERTPKVVVRTGIFTCIYPIYNIVTTMVRGVQHYRLNPADKAESPIFQKLTSNIFVTCLEMLGGSIECQNRILALNTKRNVTSF